MKNSQHFANTKIYLANSFYNEVQQQRVQYALEALEKNDTVGVVHQPFDLQYKDASINSDPDHIFGTLEWQVATFNNDVSAIANSDICVALYDMDEIDEGICMEVGMFYAMHKPVVMIPFTTKDNESYRTNLMLSRAVTYWAKPNDTQFLETFNFNHPEAQPITFFPII